MRKTSLNSSVVTTILVVLVCFTSCIPQRKYEDLRLSYDELLSEVSGYRTGDARFEQDLNACKADVKELEGMIADLQNDTLRLNTSIRTIKKTTSQLGSETSALDSELENRTREMESIIKDRESLALEVELKQKELIRKEMELEEKTKQLALQQKELEDKQAALGGKDSDIAKLKEGLVEREAKVKELETAINSQTSAIQDLESKINDALVNFTSSELQVSRKNGKVYVSLQEKLLFQSGSTTIDTKGRQAIGQVASVLRNNPEIDVAIEGHTDNVPYKGSGKVKDNWDLSVLRATSVVRILVDEHGISKGRILASGRGEYDPVADNSTTDGKKQNRRIEIILSPKLEDLFRAIGG